MKNRIIKTAIFIAINLGLSFVLHSIGKIMNHNYNDMLAGEPLPGITELSINHGVTVPFIMILFSIIINMKRLNKHYDHFMYALLAIELFIVVFMMFGFIAPIFFMCQCM